MMEEWKVGSRFKVVSVGLVDMFFNVEVGSTGTILKMYDKDDLGVCCDVQIDGSERINYLFTDQLEHLGE
jgi:hypothetical protein